MTKRSGIQHFKMINKRQVNLCHSIAKKYSYVNTEHASTSLYYKYAQYDNLFYSNPIQTTITHIQDIIKRK